MRNVIGDLRTEHANMARLLNILEKQIEIFETTGQPDYTITQDIVLYFLDFPDQCHHPKEDLVAQRLLELAPDRAGQLRGLAEQHEELGVLARKVASVLRRVQDEAELHPHSERVYQFSTSPYGNGRSALSPIGGGGVERRGFLRVRRKNLPERRPAFWT